MPVAVPVPAGPSPGALRHFDVFISHATQDSSHECFNTVKTFFEAKNRTVYNPTTRLTHAAEINAEAMQDAVRRSRLVIAALSEAFFESKWCLKEIEAAKEKGIKVVPVFSGDYYPNKQVDRWVAEYKRHPQFGYIFNENARDVLNKQSDRDVSRTLNFLNTLL